VFSVFDVQKTGVFALRILAVILLAFVVNACTSQPNTVLDLGLAVPNPKFGDNDPVEWPGRTPWQYQVHGIDVAKYQGDINWAEAKRGGVSFALLRLNKRAGLSAMFRGILVHFRRCSIWSGTINPRPVKNALLQPKCERKCGDF